MRIGLSFIRRPLTLAVETRVLFQVTASVPLIVLILHGLGGKVVIVGRLRLRPPACGPVEEQALQVALPVVVDEYKQSRQGPGVIVVVPDRLWCAWPGWPLRSWQARPAPPPAP